MSAPLPPIQLVCDCCGSNEPARVTAPPWASRVAFGDGAIEWLEPPVSGARISADVRFPFAIALDPIVHALAEPPEPAVNGWEDDTSARLTEVGLVSLRLAGHDGGGSLGKRRITVDVVEVIRLEDFAHRFERRPVENLGSCMAWGPGSFDTHHVVTQREWRHVSWSAQGDLGGWMILRGATLLLAGEWGMHLSAVYAGVGAVAPEQLARLLRGGPLE